MQQYYKHKDKRALIPTKEEAGMEQDTPSVSGREKAQYPKNPIVRRGQDPELFWLNKYGEDDTDDTLSVDIRSLYRIEHISPELLLEKFYKKVAPAQTNLFEMFGNALNMDEMDKVSEYYKHSDEWKNRLIQGDSLLVMNSLLERETMAGKVQTIYIDPPYGITYGSNWQIKLGEKSVGDSDNDLSGEPEQIKAFRDTWELGIHSYLTYMRDRLIVAQQLLAESGSLFVQISDENVHLIRCLMDEIFGSENFVSLIPFRKKTMPLGSNFIEQMNDFLIFYAKDKKNLKYRQLYQNQSVEGDFHWKWYEMPDGSRNQMTQEQLNNHN